MSYKFTIQGRLPGLNDLKGSRGHPWWACQREKTLAMERVMWSLPKPLPVFRVPVRCHFKWIEPNRRRDRDNVVGGGTKVIMDALQHMEVIQNDSRRWVLDPSNDTTQIDKRRPRVEVVIEEATY